MRTKALLLTAALGVAGIATSMAQTPVYSVNAVGYVNTVLHPGFNLISNPLKSSDDTIAGLFGGGKVPVGTKIYKYTGGGFDIETYTEDEIFGPHPTLTLEPGEGAFINTGASTDVTVTFVGEVPSGAQNLTLNQGLSIVSSRVPKSGTATDLGLVAEENDKLYQYVNTGVAGQIPGYKISQVQDGEWGPPLGVLKVGEAFFLNKINAGSTWPQSFDVGAQ